MASKTQGTTMGKSPSQLKTVDDLCKKVQSLERYRTALERQWRLNLAFYKGKQYSYFPPRSNRLESLAVEDGLKPRHRVRIVSNQIMPGVQTLLAQLTKTKPRLFATPGSGAENEVRAAQMAQALLEYWWQDFGLEEKLDEALLWSIIASAGYWKVTWDPHAAKQMRFMLDPEGRPIVDESLKTAFRAELEQYGMEPEEQIVYMGDVKVDVVSPFDVFLDPSAKTFEASNYVICRDALDPDEIKARWGKQVEPNLAPSAYDSQLPFASASGSSMELTLRHVYTAYFKPTAAIPDGRYVAFTDGDSKEILADEKWPFPHNHLPLIKFSGMQVPGSVYDDAIVTHAIPHQKELNRTISQIIEYKNLTINPVMLTPIGSLRTRRSTEPGQVLEYAPISVGGGVAKPEFQALPTLPPYVFEHLRDIQARLSDIFLSAEVLQGKVPPNVEAGIAIDLLQEMATDKLAPVIRSLEASLARAGQQMLGLAQEHYIEQRLLKIRGSGGGVQVKQFTNSDIAGNISVRAEVGSGLPRTRAGRQARIERFINMGIIPPHQAHKFLDLADMAGLEAQMAADENLAYRNIDKILEAKPINPEAAQQALTAVNQGVNPMTGEPIEDPSQIQEILMQAALTPQPGLDYETHISVTGMFMKSVEFEGLASDVRQAFFTYFGALLEAASASRSTMPEPQAPRVNLQIKSTAGPTTQSKILEAAGVPVTPEDSMEPPLETWVSDDVDEPDTDATGPGQEGNDLTEAAKIVLEAKIADAQAKQAAIHKDESQAINLGNSLREQERADEMHIQKLRKAAADADLAEKKAKEPTPKPKEK